MLTLDDLIRYLGRPTFRSARVPVDADALRQLTSLFLLTLVAGMVLSFAAGIIVSGVMGEIPENVNGTMAEADPARLLLYGMLFAPLFEELIFRSWLGLPRSSLLGLPALLCVVAILAAMTVLGNTPTALMIAFGLAALYFGLVRQANAVGEAARQAARDRLFPLIFWGSALVFAMIHISNFTGGMSAALAAPILFIAITPQLMAGAVFGYVRMQVGLLAAMVFHALYNLVLVGLAVLVTTLAAMPDTTEAATSLSALLR